MKNDKNEDFRAKNGPCQPPQRPPCDPKVLKHLWEAKFGLKCRQLVHLGGAHQVLWPIKRPLRPSRGPKKGPFWPQEALIIQHRFGPYRTIQQEKMAKNLQS